MERRRHGQHAETRGADVLLKGAGVSRRGVHLRHHLLELLAGSRPRNADDGGDLGSQNLRGTLQERLALVRDPLGDAGRLKAGPHQGSHHALQDLGPHLVDVRPRQDHGAHPLDGDRARAERILELQAQAEILEEIGGAFLWITGRPTFRPLREPLDEGVERLKLLKKGWGTLLAENVHGCLDNLEPGHRQLVGGRRLCVLELCRVNLVLQDAD
eukprot:7340548-Pyramimonas_sp.AAC.1